ncbi:hypothetical protein E2C01_020486 [Portunus trituberculatus]|uniref:Uncharacterized protein n=1 Tax=Portunus trituberculatus TaxID=210409 RepID=A0A5B7E0L0_PORTR|nr:hypothetical protein [Portunus trituberculatus]
MQAQTDGTGLCLVFPILREHHPWSAETGGLAYRSTNLTGPTTVVKFGGQQQIIVISNRSLSSPVAARLPSLNMPPKHPATSPAMLPSIAKKTRKSLTLEVKLDIIHRHEARKLIALLTTMV